MPLDLSGVLCVLIVCTFLLLSNIPLCEWTRVYLTIIILLSPIFELTFVSL